MKMKSHGMTLMELLIAISMSALVLAGLGAIFAGTIKVWSRVQDSAGALKSGQIAMEWIMRDIREGKIVTAKSDEIEFESGVKYYLKENTLWRNEDILAKGAEKINFKYYNKTGNVENNLDKISFVSLSITVMDKNHTLDLTNGAGLRNILNVF